ncbi:Oxidoreductase (plasmid) [Klebsiella aerogenes]|nr:Oxidoreductase [Klebsiella aerogenes]
MMTRPLGKSGFSIAPLVFGGNVFGWTIDEKTSFAILDAFVDHGFDAIDTADVYSRWRRAIRAANPKPLLAAGCRRALAYAIKSKSSLKLALIWGYPAIKD